MSSLVLNDVYRRAFAVSREEYSRFLHSVYNESCLFQTLVCNDLHTNTFKYTFFLSWKREIHSTRSTLCRSRCLYNGRARAVFSKYKMSRFAFKKLAGNGELNGVAKAS
jgi:ribosomal protein S14